MDNRHCIYRHTSPSGKVYIGQTVNIQSRWGHNGNSYLIKKQDGEYQQRIFARAIIKYGWENFTHEILLEGISKSEADYAEKYLIKWYKLHNMSYNITDGGDGVLGVRHTNSPEVRKQISEFMRLHHPMKGKHHTEESKRKMSETMNNSGRKYDLRKYLKEHPEKESGLLNGIEVHQYDFNGNYIASYSSAIKAGLAVSGKKNEGNIRACINGETLSALGYIWRETKVDHIDMTPFQIVENKCGRFLILVGTKITTTNIPKAVNQYSLDGKYITTYPSIAEAKRQTNTSDHSIRLCCLHKTSKTRNGYTWEFDTVNNRQDKEIA